MQIAKNPLIEIIKLKCHLAGNPINQAPNELQKPAAKDNCFPPSASHATPSMSPHIPPPLPMRVLDIKALNTFKDFFVHESIKYKFVTP